MRRQILAVFWISIVLLAGSFAGGLHGLGDSLAVFRHIWAIALIVASVLLLRLQVRTALLGIIGAVLAMVPVVSGYFQPLPDISGDYALYQKNLLNRSRRQPEIIADILGRSPDFVTLQEVSRTNKVVFDTLAQTYPSSLFCRFNGAGGVGVLSKWPIIGDASTCAGNQGLAAMQVATPDGPMWVVSLHLLWPFPRSQSTQVSRLVSEIEQLQGPVILGGDFNMVPWSYTLRAIETASASQRAGPVVQTYVHEGTGLKLPIDHVLVPGGKGLLEVLPKLGSDHFGLLLWFDLP